MGEKKFSAKLNRHFAVIGAAAAAATGAGLATQEASAAIVYSGLVNLNVPSTTSGIYLNVVTGVNATAPAGAVGWDLNPWGSTTFNVWTNNSANPTNSDGTVINFAGGTSATLTDSLPFGANIDGTSTYGRTAGVETTGPTAFALNGADNYVGFRFRNEGTASTNFGWARFTLGASNGAQPRTLVDYAYEDSGGAIGAGVVPEPTSLGLLAVGAAGLLRRRK